MLNLLPVIVDLVTQVDQKFCLTSRRIEVTSQCRRDFSTQCSSISRSQALVVRESGPKSIARKEYRTQIYSKKKSKYSSRSAGQLNVVGHKIGNSFRAQSLDHQLLLPCQHPQVELIDCHLSPKQRHPLGWPPHVEGPSMQVVVMGLTPLKAARQQA